MYIVNICLSISSVNIGHDAVIQKLATYFTIFREMYFVKLSQSSPDTPHTQSISFIHTFLGFRLLSR
jgi:hypothetical protein